MISAKNNRKGDDHGVFSFLYHIDNQFLHGLVCNRRIPEKKLSRVFCDNFSSISHYYYSVLLFVFKELVFSFIIAVWGAETERQPFVATL